MARAQVGLDRSVVLDAALAVIDQDGLEALTMRRLARDLGVEPMSLYHWVANKEDLLDGVVEQVCAQYPSLDSLTGTWRRRVEAYLDGMRTVLLAHPGAVVLVASRPMMTAGTVAVAESALDGLVAAGFADDDAAAVLHVLLTFVLGHALGQVGSTGGVGDRDGASVAAFRSSVPATSAPRFAATLGRGTDYDAEFALGVRALLDGLAARRRR